MKHIIAAAASIDTPVRLIERRLIYKLMEKLMSEHHALVCDSPIEELLFFAIAAELVYAEPVLVSAPLGERISKPSGDGSTLFVERQVEECGWRVDFFFRCGNRRLIVECDGHDFHERTKAQAARDRSRDREVQKSGATIFRFTGSELWRDPCVCANSVIAWALSK